MTREEAVVLFEKQLTAAQAVLDSGFGSNPGENDIEAVMLCGSALKVDQCKQCAYWSGGDMSKCIPQMTTDSATALSTLQAENEKLRETVYKYATAARAIALHLKPFCDESLPYDEMIADAARKASDDLEQVKRENGALWTYIKIVDREYRRYMDRSYIDRLDELKKVWKHGQKED